MRERQRRKAWSWPGHAQFLTIEAAGYLPTREAPIANSWSAGVHRKRHSERRRRVLGPRGRITIFDFKSNRVRVTLIDGEPWFVAADVCRALGLYQNAKGQPNVTLACRKLDDDEKGLYEIKTPIPVNPEHTTKVMLVSESGLYALILRSNKPEAIEFQRWVRKEVLPAIRKTGGFKLYGADPEQIAESDDTVMPLPRTFSDALRMLADQVEKNEKLRSENAALKPNNNNKAGTNRPLPRLKRPTRMLCP